MLAPHLVLCAALLALPFTCAYSLIGMGLDMYKPPCAYGCRAVIAMAMLECHDADANAGHHDDGDHEVDHDAANSTSMDGMKMGMKLVRRHGHEMSTTPECRASNAPFMSTLAYCINQTCKGVPTAKLEQYWTIEATGDPLVTSQWTYEQSLAMVMGKPQAAYDSMAMTLNETMLVSTEDWEVNTLSLNAFATQEESNSIYS